MTTTLADVPTFDFTLAGQWWGLPIVDEAAADRAIRSIVVETAGQADQLANFRHLMREQLHRTVADARDANAHHLYLAREISPGLPLSGALGVYWPLLDTLPSDVAVAPKLARAFLKAALHVADSTGSATDEQELDPAGGAVLRRSYRTEFDPDVVEGVDTNRGEQPAIIYTFRTDYWMTSPVPGRFALFSFSSQLVDLETELVKLFDAIVSTVRWRPFPSTNGEPQ